ncbi:hypothetical protein BLNAU_16313 [Blattamonas nauphoetae]|uniref:HECT-type E3 ubiquitin transferase n=1 Tax=Blattamonas nauphoetae TaxID=2049346 RepID=A0ABQ9X8I7_9EUKA|nr:hypothetical protein BLNAU_16313 [Blattamonas nauphoetae]
MPSNPPPEIAPEDVTYISFSYTTRILALTLIRHLLLFSPPDVVNRMQRTALYSGILAHFLDEAVNPLSFNPLSSQYHLRDCLRDLFFLLIPPAGMEWLEFLIEPHLLKSSFLPSPLHPNQTHALNSLPHLHADFADTLQPFYLHPHTPNASPSSPTPTARKTLPFPPTFPLVHDVDLTEPVDGRVSPSLTPPPMILPQTPLPSSSLNRTTPTIELTSSSGLPSGSPLPLPSPSPTQSGVDTENSLSWTWHQPNYLLSPFMLPPHSVYAQMSPYFFTPILSPAALGTYHPSISSFLSSSLREAHQFKNHSYFKGWTIVDPNLVKHDASSSIHSLLRFADLSLDQTAFIALAVKEIQRLRILKQKEQVRGNDYATGMLESMDTDQYAPSLTESTLKSFASATHLRKTIQMDNSGKPLSHPTCFADWMVYHREKKEWVSPGSGNEALKVGVKKDLFPSMLLFTLNDLLSDRYQAEHAASTRQRQISKKEGKVSDSAQNADDEAINSEIDRLARKMRMEEDAKVVTVKDKDGNPIMGRLGEKDVDKVRAMMAAETEMNEREKSRNKEAEGEEEQQEILLSLPCPFIPLNVGLFWSLFDSSFVSPSLIWNEQERTRMRNELKNQILLNDQQNQQEREDQHRRESGHKLKTAHEPNRAKSPDRKTNVLFSSPLTSAPQQKQPQPTQNSAGRTVTLNTRPETAAVIFVVLDVSLSIFSFPHCDEHPIVDESSEQTDSPADFSSFSIVEIGVGIVCVVVVLPFLSSITLSVDKTRNSTFDAHSDHFLLYGTESAGCADAGVGAFHRIRVTEETSHFVDTGDVVNGAAFFLYSLANPALFTEQLIERLEQLAPNISESAELIQTSPFATEVSLSSPTLSSFLLFPFTPSTLSHSTLFSSNASTTLFCLSSLLLHLRLLIASVRLIPHTRYQIPFSLLHTILNNSIHFFKILFQFIREASSTGSAFTTPLTRPDEHAGVLKSSILSNRPALFLLSSLIFKIFHSSLSMLHTLSSSSRTFFERGGINTLQESFLLLPFLFSLFPSSSPLTPPTHISSRINVIRKNKQQQQPQMELTSSVASLDSSLSEDQEKGVRVRVSSMLNHPVSFHSSLLTIQTLGSLNAVFEANKSYPNSIGQRNLPSSLESKNQQFGKAMNMKLNRMMLLKSLLVEGDLKLFDPSLVEEMNTLSIFFIRRLTASFSSSHAKLHLFKSLYEVYKQEEYSFLKRRADRALELSELGHTIHDLNTLAPSDAFTPLSAFSHLLPSDQPCPLCERIQVLLEEDTHDKTNFLSFISTISHEFDTDRFKTENELSGVKWTKDENGDVEKERAESVRSNPLVVWERVIPNIASDDKKAVGYFEQRVPLFTESEMNIETKERLFLPSTITRDVDLESSFSFSSDDDDFSMLDDDDALSDSDQDDSDDRKDGEGSVRTQESETDRSIRMLVRKTRQMSRHFSSSKLNRLMGSTPGSGQKTIGLSRLGQSTFVVTDEAEEEETSEYLTSGDDSDDLSSRSSASSNASSNWSILSTHEANPDEPQLPTTVDFDSFEQIGEQHPYLTNGSLRGTQWGECRDDWRSDDILSLFSFFPLSGVHNSVDVFTNSFLPRQTMSQLLQLFFFVQGQSAPLPLGRLSMFYETPDFVSCVLLLCSITRSLVTNFPQIVFQSEERPKESARHVETHTFKSKALFQSMMTLFILPLENIQSAVSVLFLSLLFCSSQLSQNASASILSPYLVNSCHLPLFILFSLKFDCPLEKACLIKSILANHYRVGTSVFDEKDKKQENGEEGEFNDSLTLSHTLTLSFSSIAFDGHAFLTAESTLPQSQFVQLLPPSTICSLFICPPRPSDCRTLPSDALRQKLPIPFPTSVLSLPQPHLFKSHHHTLANFLRIVNPRKGHFQSPGGIDTIYGLSSESRDILHSTTLSLLTNFLTSLSNHTTTSPFSHIYPASSLSSTLTHPPSPQISTSQSFHQSPLRHTSIPPPSIHSFSSSPAVSRSSSCVTFNPPFTFTHPTHVQFRPFTELPVPHTPSCLLLYPSLTSDILIPSSPGFSLVSVSSLLASLASDGNFTNVLPPPILFQPFVSLPTLDANEAALNRSLQTRFPSWPQLTERSPIQISNRKSSVSFEHSPSHSFFLLTAGFPFLALLNSPAVIALTTLHSVKLNNSEKKEEANPFLARSEPKIWASQQPTLLTQLCHTISSIVEEVMGSDDLSRPELHPFSQAVQVRSLYHSNIPLCCVLLDTLTLSLTISPRLAVSTGIVVSGKDSEIGAFGVSKVLLILRRLLAHSELTSLHSSTGPLSLPSSTYSPFIPSFLPPLLRLLAAVLTSDLLPSHTNHASLRTFIESDGIALLFLTAQNILFPVLSAYISLTQPSSDRNALCAPSLFASNFTQNLSSCFLSIFSIGIAAYHLISAEQSSTVLRETLAGEIRRYSISKGKKEDQIETEEKPKKMSRRKESKGEDSDDGLSESSSDEKEGKDTSKKEEESTDVPKHEGGTWTSRKQTLLTTLVRIVTGIFTLSIPAIGLLFNLTHSSVEAGTPISISCLLSLPQNELIAQNSILASSMQTKQDPLLFLLIHLGLSVVSFLFTESFHIKKEEGKGGKLKRLGTVVYTQEMAEQIREGLKNQMEMEKEGEETMESSDVSPIKDADPILQPESHALSIGVSSSSLIYSQLLKDQTVPLLLHLALFCPCSLPVPEYPAFPVSAEWKHDQNLYRTVSGLSQLVVTHTSSLVSLEAMRVLFFILKINKAAIERSLVHVHLPSNIPSPVVPEDVKKQLMSSATMFYAWRAGMEEHEIAEARISKGEMLATSNRLRPVANSDVPAKQIPGPISGSGSGMRFRSTISTSSPSTLGKKGSWMGREAGGRMEEMLRVGQGHTQGGVVSTRRDGREGREESIDSEDDVVERGDLIILHAGLKEEEVRKKGKKWIGYEKEAWIGWKENGVTVFEELWSVCELIWRRKKKEGSGKKEKKSKSGKDSDRSGLVGVLSEEQQRIEEMKKEEAGKLQILQTPPPQ